MIRWLSGFSRRRFPCGLASLAVLLCGNARAGVAVTEFMYDPQGSDSGFEWIELFNFGSTAVDLTGWSLQDNATTRYVFGTATINPGDFIIAAQNKVNFEQVWLASAADSRVVGGVPFNLNNTSPGDGLLLRDATDATVWSLGYAVASGEAARQGQAVWLTVADFTTVNYGVPPQAGPALIERNGMDGTGTLGYEDNGFTADPYAYQVTRASGAVELGSPLKGAYKAIPEPHAALLACWAAAPAACRLFGRRRSR